MPAVDVRRGAMLAMSLAFVALGPAACGPVSTASTVCETQSQMHVFSAELKQWEPTSPFSVGPGRNDWLQVTTHPNSGLGGDLGWITVYQMKSGSSPNLKGYPDGTEQSKDPMVVQVAVADKPSWYLLTLGTGSWQLYPNDAAGIALVSCPS
jgi:hypothetical protein